jgi:branched-chain amino acid transport system ATP-binding protein
VPAEKIVKMGISHVPEGRRIFAPLTVKENIMMGAYTRSDPAGIQASLERCYKSFPRLKEREGQYGGTLSGGEQQMLAMARAMMSQPSLLLLDEPSMGLSPILVEEIFKIIVEINNLGTSILLVEQNAQMALSIANRAYVLETGDIVLSGDAKEIASNPDVKKAYLGI